MVAVPGPRVGLACTGRAYHLPGGLMAASAPRCGQMHQAEHGLLVSSWWSCWLLRALQRSPCVDGCLRALRRSHHMTAAPKRQVAGRWPCCAWTELAARLAPEAARDTRGAATYNLQSRGHNNCTILLPPGAAASVVVVVKLQPQVCVCVWVCVERTSDEACGCAHSFA